MKKALITGITGQDGAYLAKFLLEKDYQVFGSYRRTSSTDFWRLEELGIADHQYLELVELDITDPGACIRIIDQMKPDEVYNLAAQSFVAVSFDIPATTSQITGIGALNLLEAIRIVNHSIRFYQASSSEMFGKVRETPQTEQTPFHPRSPYGVAKLYAHWMTINYRESYDIFATCGILFNHESPLRGIEFVTRKISHAVASIHLGKTQNLKLGNLNAKRDWGHAAEYVDGMWRMLQQDSPDTFVLATNRTETVRDFVTLAFRSINIDLKWHRHGTDEIGIDASNDRILVSVDPRFYRQAEVDALIGNPEKAKAQLGWESKISLEEMCNEMVQWDIKRLKSSY